MLLTLSVECSNKVDYALKPSYLWTITSWPLQTMKSIDQEFKQAWQAYKPAIARVVQSYEAIPALQEELIQDIAFAVWRSLERFNHQSSLKTYILSIAHNRSISHVAKHVKEGRSTSTEDVELVGGFCPENSVVTERRENQLLQALQQLPIAQRQIVTLALEGCSYDDIATVLGITVNNVGVRLNRAKKSLKDIIESMS